MVLERRRLHRPRLAFPLREASEATDVLESCEALEPRLSARDSKLSSLHPSPSTTPLPAPSRDSTPQCCMVVSWWLHGGLRVVSRWLHGGYIPRPGRSAALCRPLTRPFFGSAGPSAPGPASAAPTPR